MLYVLAAALKLIWDLIEEWFPAIAKGKPATKLAGTAMLAALLALAYCGWSHTMTELAWLDAFSIILGGGNVIHSIAKGLGVKMLAANGGTA